MKQMLVLLAIVLGLLTAFQAVASAGMGESGGIKPTGAGRVR